MGSYLVNTDAPWISLNFLMARNSGLKVNCEHSRSLSEVSEERVVVENSAQNTILSLCLFI